MRALAKLGDWLSKTENLSERQIAIGLTVFVAVGILAVVVAIVIVPTR